MSRPPNDHHSDGRDSNGQPTIAIQSPDKPGTSPANDSEIKQTENGDGPHRETESSDSGSSKPGSTFGTSKETNLAHRVDTIPCSGQYPPSFSVAPISRARPTSHITRGGNGDTVASSQWNACRSSTSTTRNIETFTTTDKNGSSTDTSQVVDLIGNDDAVEYVDRATRGTTEEESHPRWSIQRTTCIYLTTNLRTGPQLPPSEVMC